MPRFTASSLLTTCLVLIALVPKALLGADNTSGHKSSRFISLTLCSDRLLMAIAAPEQIAAMSVFSRNANMMLTKVNHNKPMLRPQLSEVLPYADAIVLTNKHFYPQLYKQLQQLNIRVVDIDDKPQSSGELFDVVRQLGRLTGQTATVNALINTLRRQQQRLANTHHQKPLLALAIGDNGLIDTQSLAMQTLFAMVNLTAITPSRQHGHSLMENIVLTHPQVIVSFRYGHAYNDRAQILTHPVLRSLQKEAWRVNVADKYIYCFDQGIWQGAERIAEQLSLARQGIRQNTGQGQ